MFSKPFFACLYSFANTDRALVNMSDWITGNAFKSSDLVDPFLPKYFQTRRSFHIRHGVFRSKLKWRNETKKEKGDGESDIFDAYNW